MRPMVVGIAGGTGSGKTTLAEKLQAAFEREVTVLYCDRYYRPLAHFSAQERAAYNFDHPDALDIPLLEDHLSRLIAGEKIEVPVYDFTTHLRTAETEKLEPKRILIVEGILALALEKLREKMDVRIYVDTDADVRLLRRIQRDMVERGRTLESICRQYLGSVKPMHEQFVEPSRRFADIIIPEGGQNNVAAEMLLGKIRDYIIKTGGTV